MGDLFEYELWGATEYEVFTMLVPSPSGMAVTPEGRILVADYDSGDVFAFDRNSRQLGRIPTGSAGVTGIELECSDASDTSCRLWFTNIEDKTVSYISIETPCASSDVGELPATVNSLKQACVSAEEACKVDRDVTTPALQSADRQRPDFTSHFNDASWQERMVIHHSYGKDCTGIANADTFFNTCAASDCAADGLGADCVGTVRCRVGANGRNNNPMGGTSAWEDQDAVKCPDRTDCTNMNLDLLVMAGYFCHPCLPNPCMNSGTCANAEPRQGFTCSCQDGFAGNSCQVDTRVSACGALSAAGGTYTPAASCQVAGKAGLGQACNLQCANDNMVRVPTSPVNTRMAATVPASSTSASPPTQVELLQRRCELDAQTMSAVWTGSSAACACRPRYFGSDCSKLIKAAATMETKVGSAGADVMLEGGHGVRIPKGALAEGQEVIVSVTAFKEADLAGAGAFPPVAEGMRAVSDVMELLPEGISFAKDVTVSIGLASVAVKEDHVALFYWDVTSGSWTELAGSGLASAGDALVKDAGRLVQGPSSHFSRWVVLEKPRKSSTHWGVWVGIAVAVLVVVALLFFVANRFMFSRSEAPAKDLPQYNKGDITIATGEDSSTQAIQQSVVAPAAQQDVALQPMSVSHYSVAPGASVGGQSFGSWVQPPL